MTTKEFIPVSIPSLDEETIDAVSQVLRSGWLATGAVTERFEKDLADYFGVSHVATITSGTAGLHLSIVAAGIPAGSEIITTPFTFVATANAIMHAGCMPVFADIDPHTLNISAKDIEKKITPKTKAIMPVHYAGIPVDMDEIYQIAKEHNLRVIEDCAHAFGSHYKNKKIGSFGDIQVFSFHPIKNMTTGEGGCVILRDEEEKSRFAQMRFHGINRSIWDRFKKKSGSLDYDVVLPGYKFNMSDIQSAIGICQLKKVDEMNAKRRKIISRYLEAFDKQEKIFIPNKAMYEYTHSGHLFPILINLDKTTLSREDIISKLKELNVGSIAYYPPLHLFSFYRDKFSYNIGDFPISEDAGKRVLCLPLFPDMSESMQDVVIDSLIRVLDEK